MRDGEIERREIGQSRRAALGPRRARRECDHATGRSKTRRQGLGVRGGQARHAALPQRGAVGERRDLERELDERPEIEARHAIAAERHRDRAGVLGGELRHERRQLAALAVLDDRVVEVGDHGDRVEQPALAQDAAEQRPGLRRRVRSQRRAVDHEQLLADPRRGDLEQQPLADAALALQHEQRLGRARAPPPRARSPASGNSASTSPVRSSATSDSCGIEPTGVAGEQLDQPRGRAQPAEQHRVVAAGGLVELEQPVQQQRRGRRQIARQVGAALGGVVDQHREQPRVEAAAGRIAASGSDTR